MDVPVAGLAKCAVAHCMSAMSRREEYISSRWAMLGLAYDTVISNDLLLFLGETFPIRVELFLRAAGMLFGPLSTAQRPVDFKVCDLVY